MAANPQEDAVNHGASCIFAAGLNAHGQLDLESKGKDVHTFRSVSKDKDVDVLFAGWSTTVLASPYRGVWSLGNQQLGENKIYVPSSSKYEKLREGDVKNAKGLKGGCSAYGDHEGLRGLLIPAEDGHELYVAESVTGGDDRDHQQLTLLTTPSSPSISHIALAGNGRVALTFTQAPRGRLCHVVEFEDLSRFTAWYRDPSDEKTYPDAHHMLPGRPMQLVANTATFALLMEDGEVYSWGDARLGTLGRSINGDSAPANKPALVEALGGLRIVKLASGGWLNAAISHDGAMYLWGAMMPGFEHSIQCLQRAGPGEVVLVTIGGDAEPLDVLNVAVGDNHVAVVTTDHRLWVVGDNANGQLSIDPEAHGFVEDWTECKPIEKVQHVFCGPQATFAIGISRTREQS